MGIIEEIKARLPVCGGCKDCKIIHWGSKTKFTGKGTSHIGSLKRKDGLESDDPENPFIMRCMYLKQAIMYPQEVEGCELFQAIGTTRKND